MEAVFLALRAIARPGDTVAIESPTYFPLLQHIETLGMKVLEIPTHPRTGISVDALDLATEKPGSVSALLLVPTYSNPMGSSMPEDQRRRLVALCAEREIPIIEDDVCGEVTFDEMRPKPLKAWDETGNVLLCSSFGKTVAPALRIGWMLPGRHRKEIEILRLAHVLFLPQAPQLALAEFVANGGHDRHLRKLRTTLRDQARRMRDVITASFPAGSRVSRPAGGYVIWIELPPRVDAVDLFRRARSDGIVIAPGPLFTTTNRFKNCIRLSYSQRWSREIEDAVRRIGALARDPAEASFT